LAVRVLCGKWAGFKPYGETSNGHHRSLPSGEQIGAGRRELHVGSGLMQFQPAPFNGELEAGTVFRGCAFIAEQERAIELLDIDPAILNRFESVCVLQQSARGLLRVGVGGSVVSFKS
jgi:hypothetical protein